MIHQEHFDLEDGEICGGMFFPEFRNNKWIDVCGNCGAIEIPTADRLKEIEEMIGIGMIEPPGGVGAEAPANTSKTQIAKNK